MGQHMLLQVICAFGLIAANIADVGLLSTVRTDNVLLQVPSLSAHVTAFSA